jgi:tRNA threonylcarbamoyladenosine biosynthesis protein TsaE
MTHQDATINADEMISHSAGETFLYAATIGKQLRGGEILLLDGPLGAGKTIFAKGLASALSIDPDEVTSPTFTLVNHYRGKLALYHLDLYRLSSGEAVAHAVGLDELLEEIDAVVLIEWGERLQRYPFPEPCWQVSIQRDVDETRKISVKRCQSFQTSL